MTGQPANPGAIVANAPRAESATQQMTADQRDGLWDSFTVQFDRTIDLSPPAASQSDGEGPGSRIGPYKLVALIGEGGMGAVYMAEQEKPVRRRVALKIIKPGMDSAQVISRFEAERQALAMMDHQGIAR